MKHFGRDEARDLARVVADDRLRNDWRNHRDNGRLGHRRLRAAGAPHTKRRTRSIRLRVLNGRTPLRRQQRVDAGRIHDQNAKHERKENATHLSRYSMLFRRATEFCEKTNASVAAGLAEVTDCTTFAGGLYGR